MECDQIVRLFQNFTVKVRCNRSINSGMPNALKTFIYGGVLRAHEGLLSESKYRRKN